MLNLVFLQILGEPVSFPCSLPSASSPPAASVLAGELCRGYCARRGYCSPVTVHTPRANI
ncbi:hypothetical protein SLEP1_g22737 [Rubroshorea leprosula]|uniref:Uncharacterized protein n=1 Tax=Rubroshorea leprosula TaxID=152421 RepID=A0AAV5JHE7_9ROSI|nr:hypothetical protein SLEP1_g22737 [Rubroshorea leprosula]